MPDYSATMDFTFIVPPKKIALSDAVTPTIKVDASGSSLVMQAFLLRILPLLSISSREGAMDYVFETGV